MAVVIFIAMATLLGMALWTTQQGTGPMSFLWRPGTGRPAADRFVFDEAHVLPDATRTRLETLLRRTHQRIRLDFVIITLSTPPEQPLTPWARQRAIDWERGKLSGGRRAALLVVIPGTRTTHLYVATGLSRVYPPDLIAYINARPLPASGSGAEQAQHIERMATRLVHRALKRQLLLNDSPTPGGTAVASALPSSPTQQGDTDDTIAQTGVLLPIAARAAVASAPRKQARTYRAQPTAQQAWDTYLDALRWQQSPPLGIYDTAANRALLGGELTPAHMTALYQRYQGQKILLREEGERAVVIFPKAPAHTLAPVFLRQTRAGWQIDGAMMFEGGIGYDIYGHWRFARKKHAYAFAFRDFQMDENGYALQQSSVSTELSH